MDKLAKKIKESIDQIWADYYTEQGIVTGDIAPLELLKYENCIDEIAKTIQQVGDGNKRKFTVTIEEIVSQDFEVIADDIDEAMEIAEEKYNNGEFVLESGELTYKQMMADDGNGDCTEWTEF